VNCSGRIPQLEKQVRESREKSACLDFLIARDLIIFQVAPGL
jgi:hypothetical protein